MCGGAVRDGSAGSRDVGAHRRHENHVRPPDCATGINVRRRSLNDKGKGNQKPWCDRDDDGARECKNDDADEAGLAADASSIFSSSFNNFDSDGTAKKLPHHRRPDRREEGRLLPDHFEHRGGAAYR